MGRCPERRNIEFKTLDGLTLRGWFYPAGTKDKKTPAIIITHGWSLVKEMYLDTLAERFQEIGLASLVYDHRSFGSSDGTPRFEVDGHNQAKDTHEAISYVMSLPEVDPTKIAIWGYSLSGSHGVRVAAVDRRVKALVTVSPMLSSVRLLNRMVLRDARAGLDKTLMDDREARARGEEPTYGRITSPSRDEPAFLPFPDANSLLLRLKATVAPNWENRHTLQSIFNLQTYDPSGYVEAVAPTPWLMFQADNDMITVPDVELGMFEKARQPKEFELFHGGHFDVFEDEVFEGILATMVEFLKRRLKF
ncbi:uncharacterized protein H6S33_000895 [Morchella sextelata]|uniref:uncharacterized protein n=1 Tax=Morchella sextelata TaxID=1174677 RepID=UPI001D04549B|nr:uncharacterized protein H6S33_000895 [Morchella sextelata]KAH0615259.1 hypothetical protein H6S33_000895 [Morchella sextelata]